MGENDEDLLPASSLQLQRWEISRYLKFFALIDDICGDSHRVVVLAEVGSVDIVDLEQVLDETT